MHVSSIYIDTVFAHGFEGLIFIFTSEWLTMNRLILDPPNQEKSNPINRYISNSSHLYNRFSFSQVERKRLEDRSREPTSIVFYLRTKTRISNIVIKLMYWI